MGEIGRDRLEYQFEMSYCDIVLIIRGYRRRNVLQYQLQRQQIVASAFAFSGNKDHLTPEQLVPLYCDRYIDQKAPQLSQDEISKELELINNMNEQLKAGGKF